MPVFGVHAGPGHEINRFVGNERFFQKKPCSVGKRQILTERVKSLVRKQYRGALSAILHEGPDHARGQRRPVRKWNRVCNKVAPVFFPETRPEEWALEVVGWESLAGPMSSRRRLWPPRRREGQTTRGRRCRRRSFFLGVLGACRLLSMPRGKVKCSMQKYPWRKE